MTCVDCHDPHSQGYRDVFGNPLRGRFDDGQCTGCHAAIEAEAEAHTFHPAGSPGAACTSCHMPYIQHPELSDAIPYGRSDHTIAIPRPGVDERMGLASACSRCHGDMTVTELAARVTEWWGELRPHRAEVAALIAATAPGASRTEFDRALAEAAALGGKHGLAKVMAMDAWLRAWMAREQAVSGLDAARARRRTGRRPGGDDGGRRPGCARGRGSSASRRKGRGGGRSGPAGPAATRRGRAGTAARPLGGGAVTVGGGGRPGGGSPNGASLPAPRPGGSA